MKAPEHTFPLDLETSDRLARLATALGSTVDALAGEAIRSFLDLNEYQMQEIQVALNEADQGVFADPEEVRAAFARWGVRGT